MTLRMRRRGGLRCWVDRDRRRARIVCREAWVDAMNGRYYQEGKDPAPLYIKVEWRNKEEQDVSSFPRKQSDNGCKCLSRDGQVWTGYLTDGMRPGDIACLPRYLPRMGDGMVVVLRRSKPSGDASTHAFRNGISGQATGSRGRSKMESPLHTR